jgi:hypothetical protein
MMFQNPDLQFCMDTLRKEMIFCLENIGESDLLECALDDFSHGLKIIDNQNIDLEVQHVSLLHHFSRASGQVPSSTAGLPGSGALGRQPAGGSSLFSI